MAAWDTADFTLISSADELRITSAAPDGQLRTPVPIWVVAHNGALFVRSARGVSARWYRGIRERHEGHIDAAGIGAEVFVADIAADDAVQEQVDAAYRKKYGRYGASYIAMMLAPQARAATLAVTPR
ncbi:DUF2255 family protein [Actinoplanes bogorensis]|uniref:DUF2255 family protein n=1 Tax=Paractinoplanes bogorensis TaxID=1610840 RepID=A0ABS5YEU6_9ACTN|nr:DUF2255 family protein [Actinoplanes bogorensis]MBU2661934.1 DUF2255 family protein [Actinoplanes bogorensis]